MTREQTLLEFKDKMDKAGIEFMLGHGTCLGAYRDHALIKDDHDIDISIFKSDVESVKKVIAWQCNARGSRFNQFTFIAHGHKIDILFWQKNGDVYNLNFRHRKPDVLPAKFAETKSIEFLGQTFLIPKYTEEYLEYYYDKTWRTKINGKPAKIRKA